MPGTDYSAQLFRIETRRLYRTTTEDISGYLHALKPAGARCLTVAASGDHLVNLLYAGAAQVISFDREPLAGHVQDLKLATILSFELEEFLRFWGVDGRPRSWGNKNAGELCAELLSPKVRHHLGYGADSWNRMLDRAGELFTGYISVRAWNPYLDSPEAYARAQAAILRGGTRPYQKHEVSGHFVECDVRNFVHTGFAEGFDVIVLSNILEAMVADCTQSAYHLNDVTGEYPRNQVFATTPLTRGPLRAMVRDIVAPLTQGLNPGGRMMAGYFYRFNTEQDSLERLAKLFQEETDCTVNLVRCKLTQSTQDDIAVVLTRNG